MHIRREAHIAPLEPERINYCRRASRNPNPGLSNPRITFVIHSAYRDAVAATHLDEAWKDTQIRNPHARSLACGNNYILQAPRKPINSDEGGIRGV